MTKLSPQESIEAKFAYTAYGLDIQSTLPLPELVANGAAADVVIRMGKVKHPPSETNGSGWCLWATAQEACLHWPGEATILVRGGGEIIVEPAPGVADCILRLCILGPALGILLHQRQRWVFHASVVAVSGGAVAFVGETGFGKSTMAAAFHARGHDLIADDIMALDMDGSQPMVLPGFPQFKLWPEAAVALGQAPETLPRLEPDVEKRARRITAGFSPIPVPLRCIYLLDEGPKPEIESLQPQEAWLALMPHWYGARFGPQLLQALGLSIHFQQCTNLASQVPIYRLKRPRSLEVLPDVALLVEAHLEKLEIH